MSQSSQPTDESGVTEQEKFIGHPGRLLASARKERNLEVDAVATDLGMTPGAIRDLENEHFQRFSADIYLRGYLRNYARLVGVDDERIQRALDRFHEREREEQSTPRRSERRPAPVCRTDTVQQARIRRWTVLLFVVGFVLFAALVGAVVVGQLLGSGS